MIYFFIAYKLANQLQIKYENMTANLYVSMPLGDVMIANLVCRNYMLTIGEAHLVMILMWDFDIILDVNWLLKHHVILNYFTRELKINSP